MENPVAARFYRDLADRAARALAESGDAARIRIQIGSATCENAAGAQGVLEEFRKHIRASGREDIVIHRTGCTGRCSKEPIVGIQVPGQVPVQYERVDRDLVHQIFTRHVLQGEPLPEHALDGSLDHPAPLHFLFCEGARCPRGQAYRHTFDQKLAAAGFPQDRVKTSHVRCFGACAEGAEGLCAHVLARPEGLLYRVSGEADLDAILDSHVRQGQPVARLVLTESPIDLAFF